VVGAIRTRITTAAEAAALVKRAAAARAVEATAMNAVSSRSHSVFMLYICGHHAGSSSHLLGGLNLVDLAGRYAFLRDQVMIDVIRATEGGWSWRGPGRPVCISLLSHLLQGTQGTRGGGGVCIRVEMSSALQGHRGNRRRARVIIQF